MDEINEFLETILLDVGAEGIGCSAGISILWALFFGGAFLTFREILNCLVYTI